MITYITATAAAVIIISLLLIGRGKKKPNLPPGPIHIPVIGYLNILFAPSFLGSIANLVAKYGDVIYLGIGIRRYLIVSSPSAVEECLSTNDIIFCNRITNTMADKYISYGKTTLNEVPYGPLWRDLRKLATLELLSAVRTANSANLREEEMRMTVKGLFKRGDGGAVKVTVTEVVKEVIMNTFTQTLFGKRYFGKSKDVSEEASKHLHDIVVEVVRLIGIVSIEHFFPAVAWFRANKMKSRFKKVSHEFDAIVQSLVDERREYRRRNKLSVNEEGKHILLDVMLSLQEKDPVYHTDVMIKGLIMLFLVGADEGPTSSVDWCLALLLNNPDILTKLRQEIDSQVGTTRLISDADLPHIPLLHHVLKEAMRIYPFGPLLTPHRSSADCKVAGYDIPSGTILLVNALHIQRNPAIWDEPMKFKPERFEGEQEDPKARFKNLPFGAGRRMCPAELLSYRLMMLVLGMLVQCFDWGRVGEEMVDMTEVDGMNLLRAHELEAMCKPREVMMDTLMNL